MTATTDHARDLAEALRDLLAALEAAGHDLPLVAESVNTCGCMCCDDNTGLADISKQIRETIRSEVAIRARRALTRFEWEGR